MSTGSQVVRSCRRWWRAKQDSLTEAMLVVLLPPLQVGSTQRGGVARKTDRLAACKTMRPFCTALKRNVVSLRLNRRDTETLVVDENLATADEVWPRGRAG